MLFDLKVLECASALLHRNSQEGFSVRINFRPSYRRIFFSLICLIFILLCIPAIVPCSQGRVVGTKLSELIGRGMDPRMSRIIHDSFTVRALPPVLLREVPIPTAPREFQLKMAKVTVFPNIQMHPSSTTAQSEMSIVTHPLNPNVVLAGANAFSRSPIVQSQGWYHTIDGGANWEGGDTLPIHSNLAHFVADPAVAIDLDGNLFFNAFEYKRTTLGAESTDVFIARSSDQGITWSQAIVPHPSQGKDKNHLAVDINPGSPLENNLYTAYTDFEPSPSPVMFSRSTDGGATLTSPLAISGSIGQDFAQGVNLAVGPNGELYACWSGYDNWPPPVTTRLGFNKSTDGGDSWETAKAITSVLDVRGELNKGAGGFRLNSMPSMAVDRSNGPQMGWIYIVYAERTLTTPDIVLIRSSDGGATWSTPRKVNQDASGNDQWSPWICVDPVMGHLYIVYYDSRNFPANDSAQVFMSASADGGDTFEDILVSDVAFLPATVPGINSYMGDYIGISAFSGVVWPCWNDNRTGIHQAYTSKIVFVEVGGPPKIGVTPDTLDFEQGFLEHPETLSITVRNIGYPETLRVSNILSDHTDFAPEIVSLALPGGFMQKINIVFKPSALGPVAANLTIFSSDTANPTVTVALKGIGVYPPALAVSPESLNFTLNKGNSAMASLMVSDTGLGTLSFSIQVEEFETELFSPVRLTEQFRHWTRMSAYDSVSRSAVVTSNRSSKPGLFQPLIFSGGSVGPRILLLTAEFPEYVSDIRAKLLGTGRFSTVDTKDVSIVGSNPTLIQLQQYDGVFVWSGFDFFYFFDAVALGNVLADYIDGGGGVVTAIFALQQGTEVIQGRFNDQNYWAIQPGNIRFFTQRTLGTIYDPEHPTIQNVITFDGGPFSFRLLSGAVSTGATLIASWSGGEPLIAVKRVGGKNRVDLGFYPVSSDIDTRFWQSTTDGAIIMANALEYASVPAPITVRPALGTVLPSSTEYIAVNVSTQQLEVGSFQTHILVSSNDPIHPVDTVPVNLTVRCPTGKGDLNGDTLLTIADIVLELNCVFLNERNGTVGNDCNHCYSDVNCDGLLRPTDAVLELNFVFLLTPPPCL